MYTINNELKVDSFPDVARLILDDHDVKSVLGPDGHVLGDLGDLSTCRKVVKVVADFTPLEPYDLHVEDKYRKRIRVQTNLFAADPHRVRMRSIAEANVEIVERDVLDYFDDPGFYFKSHYEGSTLYIDPTADDLRAAAREIRDMLDGSYDLDPARSNEIEQNKIENEFDTLASEAVSHLGIDYYVGGKIEDRCTDAIVDGSTDTAGDIREILFRGVRDCGEIHTPTSRLDEIKQRVKSSEAIDQIDQSVERLVVTDLGKKVGSICVDAWRETDRPGIEALSRAVCILELENVVNLDAYEYFKSWLVDALANYVDDYGEIVDACKSKPRPLETIRSALGVE